MLNNDLTLLVSFASFVYVLGAARGQLAHSENPEVEFGSRAGVDSVCAK